MAKKNSLTEQEAAFDQQLNTKITRKLKARQHKYQTIWLGLGMMGLIGWSVVVPTVLGVMLGVWIDKHHTGPQSWTLMLLMFGLILGCANAWYWLDKEQRAIHKQDNQHD